VIAHVGGLPVEEVLPALLTGGGAWLILWLTSLGARLRATRHAALLERPDTIVEALEEDESWR
jgi:hypothetical protein